MIPIKSARDADCMRRAGRVAGLALREAGLAVRPGVTTKALDRIVRRVLAQQGATPSFLGYQMGKGGGFPGAACVSLNEQVIHGIPGARVLRNGDIVSIDVGAYVDGFHGDCAATFPVGDVSEEALRLIRVTRQCFFDALAMMREGSRVGDVSHAIQQRAESNGYSVVRAYTGHGVGAQLHEDPEVPSFGAPGRGARLIPGMTLAVEPMVNQGTGQIKNLRDNWTVVTEDGKLSAHYEHTVLITSGAPEMLTAWEEDA